MKDSRDVAGKSGTSFVVKIERGIDAQSQEFLDFVIKCSRRRNDALITRPLQRFRRVTIRSVLWHRKYDEIDIFL